jgi:BR serine/threonine kinase
LEFAENGDLFEYITRRAVIDIGDAMEIFRGLICALEYLHAQNIYHGDVKPENILLFAKHHVKLADFGFAIASPDGLISTTCGSPHYAAPEVIKGHVHKGELADVWSAGVVLYALLTGRLPFDDDSPSRLFRKILSGHFEMPNVCPELQDLIMRLLTVDCSKRIGIDEIKKHRAFLMNLPGN